MNRSNRGIHTKQAALFLLAFGGAWFAEASINYSNVVLSANPVGYWRLGEANPPPALLAIDSSGNANHGAYVSFDGSYYTQMPGAIEGDPNKAAGFNNGTNYVSVASSASLNLTTGMTFEAWVTAKSLGGFFGFGTGYSGLMMKANPAWTSGYGMYWNGGNLYLFADAATVTTPFGVTNDYRYVAGTYDGSQLKIYLDGILQNTSVYAGGITATANTLLIGAGNDSGNLPNRYGWDGKIDEPALYNYALSDSQIFAHFQAGIIPEPATVSLLALAGLMWIRARGRKAA